MYVMAVNHDVADYATWKNAFDAFSPARGDARFHRVNRNIDNQNNVTVVAGFDTVEAALKSVTTPTSNRSWATPAWSARLASRSLKRSR